jgi:endonuclease/exonuclease/phosphatase family metal-dependent hydrolase
MPHPTGGNEPIPQLQTGTKCFDLAVAILTRQRPGTEKVRRVNNRMDETSEYTSTQERFKVATYNVHRSIGTDGIHDVARTAAVIRDTGAAVLALQEVETHRDDPDALARSTGMTPLPGHTITSTESTYGNLILTKLEVESSKSIDLSWERREPRGVIDARLRTPTGLRIRCLATHLGLAKRERIYQHRLLHTLLQSDWQGPTLLLGDFNEWHPFASAIRILDGLLGKARPRRSFPSRLPLLPLDRIWVHPSSMLSSIHTHHSRIARLASDHLPVVAELDTGKLPVLP